MMILRLIIFLPTGPTEARRSRPNCHCGQVEYRFPQNCNCFNAFKMPRLMPTTELRDVRTAPQSKVHGSATTVAHNVIKEAGLPLIMMQALHVFEVLVMAFLLM